MKTRSTNGKAQAFRLKKGIADIVTKGARMMKCTPDQFLARAILQHAPGLLEPKNLRPIEGLEVIWCFDADWSRIPTSLFIDSSKNLYLGWAKGDEAFVDGEWKPVAG